ncbi:hypothetical protein M409DRAFT_19094 [Zasmidium cellare ATCC 36951]|uniref:Myb-like domain-containing protein n=1 Tax=Zasmidium cellare ATCC 36951 TaxID=1080233 RepID=A0A6A6CWN5_ZASCE|nr:uncharacterized protein M409DRAFT_19094 [Zasmidium cellare ATCC 36951]KAF2171123.1 hypothetical protein M409DRAFT_19094 [Zasmidium cellare ATCC 36951]
MVNWDDAEQKKLLFAMVTLLQAGKSASWENVATMLGEGHGANAVRQQWAKIKKDCGGHVGTIVDGDGEGTPAKSKPRAKKAASEKSTGKRKGKKDVDEDDGGDDEESPSKKAAYGGFFCIFLWRRGRWAWVRRGMYFFCN